MPMFDYISALGDDAASAATRTKISSFAMLPPGWLYGRGVTPTSDTVRGAIQILDYLRLLGFPDTDAFPGGAGEIAVTAYRGDHYVSVGLEPDGSVTVLYQQGDVDMVDQEKLTGADAQSLLDQIAQGIEQSCGTPDWYIEALSTISVESFTTTPLRTMARMDAHQLLKNRALYEIMSLYVRTFANTQIMSASLGTLQYSGYSMEEPSSYLLPVGQSSIRHPMEETFVTTT